MSSYTMTLKEVLDMLTIDQAETNEHRLEIGRQKLFDFDYPIFDVAYKKVFETNFIRYFYFREIGFETEGMFKFQLQSWLHLNMPYFNKLFESELIDFDPLENSRVIADHKKLNDTIEKGNKDIGSTTGSKAVGTSTTNASVDSNTANSTDTTAKQNVKGTSLDNSTSITDTETFERDLKSNTPDSRLAITTQDGKGVIEYASEIREEVEKDKSTNLSDSSGSTTNESTSTGSSDSISETNAKQNQTANSTDSLDSTTAQNEKELNEINAVEDFITHRAGKIGIQTYSKMLQEYRSSFIRIEVQIFNEMNRLFMLIY